MARILLVDEGRGRPALLEALEDRGHQVIWCGGGPTPYIPCHLLREGRCMIASSANAIVFSCPLYGDLPGRSYGGTQLLRAYRSHFHYGRLPMIVNSFGDPGELEGPGPLRFLNAYKTDGNEVADVLQTLLDGGTEKPPQT